MDHSPPVLLESMVPGKDELVKEVQGNFWLLATKETDSFSFGSFESVFYLLVIFSLKRKP